MQKSSLWDTPIPQPVVKPKPRQVVITQEEKKEEKPVVEKVIKQTTYPNNKRCKYVITAGKNKVGRQLYLCSWDDAPTEWMITVVPYPTTKTRCYELISLAKRQIKEDKDNKIVGKRNKDIPFEIVEWKEH